MSISRDLLGDYDFNHALPTNTPAEIKVNFVKYYVSDVLYRIRVWVPRDWARVELVTLTHVKEANEWQ